MDFSKITELAGAQLMAVEMELANSLCSEIPTVNELVLSTIKSGGKRIRPLVLTISAGMCGYFGDLIPKVGVILEYIHTSSLLHDDVIDGATSRRGKPSANAIHGNNITVLSGDYLYATAFNNLAKLDDRDHAIVVSRAVAAMSEGEIFQMLKTGDISLSMEDYLKIIYGKTSALFAAACECGAIMAGMDADKRKALHDYGCHVGYAFQLQDDILDYFGEESVIGKKPGTDLAEKKVTLPIMLLLQELEGAEREEAIEAFLSVQLSEIMQLLVKHDIQRKSTAVVQMHIENALFLLNNFPDSQYKEALVAITYELSRRKS
ncbi:MAG: polyprenyl synthetase family protein [Deferribacteraceae bacterium]|jgi:octaprenyl-diphosphate synthase|nr:polyprenyl synthetase family protein [Deferribacteraceae bacterium]